MRRIFTILLLTIVLLNSFVLVVLAGKYGEGIIKVQRFDDVPVNSWYFDYVFDIEFYGLMEGTSATTFEPNATLTRAMLVTMIGRFEERLNGTLGEARENPFSDVKAGKWYTDYVIWAAENGIVNGYPDGTFRPNAPVTREEAVTILGRYYQKNEPNLWQVPAIYIAYFPHTDTDEVSDWAKGGLSLGMDIGAVHYEKANLDAKPEDAPKYYFRPKDTMTRAEVAKVAYIFLSNLEASIERGFCIRYGYLTAIK